MNNKIKLLIADDHLLFIEGLKSLLQNEARIKIVGVAHDGKELLKVLPHLKPDVVLLDINMPQMNGIDACRYVHMSDPSVRMIIVSTYNEQHLIEKAKQNGAKSYLLKDCSKEDLLETILWVYEGKTSFSMTGKPTSENAIVDSFSKRFQLSRREIDVLRLMKVDCKNQEIADQLFLSVYTIETHRKNIKRKLGLTSQASMIKFLMENQF